AFQHEADGIEQKCREENQEKRQQARRPKIQVVSLHHRAMIRAAPILQTAFSRGRSPRRSAAEGRRSRIADLERATTGGGGPQAGTACPSAAGLWCSKRARS